MVGEGPVGDNVGAVGATVTFHEVRITELGFANHKFIQLHRMSARNQFSDFTLINLLIFSPN